jgi:hypothetical protein
LLEGEPGFSRRTPLLIAAPLAVARLVLHACLATLRLLLSTLLALVVAAVLLNVGLAFAGGHTPAIGDAGDYLTHVLRVAGDWAGRDQPSAQDTSGLISETSSTSTYWPASHQPSTTAGLVATLSDLAPPDLRDTYQQAVPMLEQYDAMLGDVQTALANDRDLDTFFADVDPWLNQNAAPTPTQ